MFHLSVCEVPVQFKVCIDKVVFFVSSWIFEYHFYIGDRVVMAFQVLMNTERIMQLLIATNLPAILLFELSFRTIFREESRTVITWSFFSKLGSASVGYQPGKFLLIGDVYYFNAKKIQRVINRVRVVKTNPKQHRGADRRNQAIT